MNNFCVYKHTSPTGKVYIGITSQNPERRWRKDGSGYRYNTKFMNAIRKYGWNNFEHEVLFENLTEEDALEIEKDLIQKYNSYRNGYNSSLGGDYGGYTEEVKNKISNSVKELWKNDEYRKHMSEAHKGIATSLGHKHSEETKKKMSQIVKERCKDENYRKKLSESAKKRAKREGSLYYSENAKKAWRNKESRERIIASNRGNRYTAKKVLCVETNIIYPSVLDASKAMGCTRDAIGSVCRGIHKTSCGYHWRFADE